MTIIASKIKLGQLFRADGTWFMATQDAVSIPDSPDDLVFISAKVLGEDIETAIMVEGAKEFIVR